jgi:hypothetical protein
MEYQDKMPVLILYFSVQVLQLKYMHAMTRYITANLRRVSKTVTHGMRLCYAWRSLKITEKYTSKFYFFQNM